MKWSDPPSAEWETLNRLRNGAMLLTTAELLPLRDRGLVEEKLGGAGLSAAGKSLSAGFIAEIRARRVAQDGR